MSLEQTFQVAAGADDAHEREDETFFSSTSTSLSMDSLNSGLRNNVGMRFTNVTVPKNAFIISAHLQLEVDGVVGDDPRGDIHYQDADDPDDFVSTADVTQRTRSATSVEWVVDNIGDGARNSPEIKVLIQEIVNRAGWVSGNAAVILLIPRAVDPTKKLVFDAENETGDEGPRLIIEHATGAVRSRAAGGIL